MSPSQPRLDATALQSLLILVRAQNPQTATLTLAEAEAAVMTVPRQIGPQLLQAALEADQPALAAGALSRVASKSCSSGRNWRECAGRIRTCRR